MAGPTKKRVIQEESHSDPESNDEIEDIYTGEEVVQTDFEGRNPESSDFHGIKQLLQQLFLKAHINLSELSDILIAQSNVGSVLKQSVDDVDDSDEDDMDVDDVFGITSVVNLTDKKDIDCIQQIRSLLMTLSEKYATKEVIDTIKDILSNDTKHVGLLINERFINIPPQVSDPLFDSLFKEINRANAKKQKFNFNYFILICKLYKNEDKTSENDLPQIHFSNAEEEIFDKETDIKFEFSVKDESDSGVSGHWLEEDVTMTPYRRILLFPAEKLPTILQNVKSFASTT